MKIKAFILCLLTIVLLCGCGDSHEYGPYKGKVVDKETGQPIEGAVVFMQFFTSSPNLGGATYYVGDAEEVLTDHNGKFFIPKQKLATYKFLHGWEEHGGVTIFKPGYGVFPGHPEAGPIFMPNYSIPENKNMTIKLPKLKTIEERKKNLDNIFIIDKIPYEKWELLYELRDMERVSLGLTPYGNPLDFGK